MAIQKHLVRCAHRQEPRDKRNGPQLTTRKRLPGASLKDACQRLADARLSPSLDGCWWLSRACNVRALTPQNHHFAAGSANANRASLHENAEHVCARACKEAGSAHGNQTERGSGPVPARAGPTVDQTALRRLQA